MKRSNITTVILTLNEEINLERCIQSVAWSDKIYIIDSGSTDATLEKARQLGAHTLVNKQPPPFRIDIQRNWALDNMETDSEWILFLDADETVPEDLKAELLKIANAPAPEFDAYELTPRYLFWGRWLKRTQGYPNWHARFLRNCGVRFTGGVWEQFQSGYKIGRIHIPYDHYANSKGLSDWLKRHDRYSSWDANKIYDYLQSADPSSLGTQRKLLLRKVAAKLWVIRPFARFFHMYFLRLGILEGIPSLTFCTLYFFYEMMTVIKIVEIKRLKNGKPL